MGIRKTLRELEEEENQGTSKGKDLKPDYQGQLSTLVTQLIEDIAKMNVEYGKYFTGAEKRPPFKQREALDKLVAQVNALKKHASVQSLIFKIQTVLSSYLTNKTAWERRLLEMEKTTPR